MIGTILGWLGYERRRTATEPKYLRGRYDAAATTDENSRHWANADGLSASAANSLEVRSTLRKRSRYEMANNPYGRGMIDRLATHTIGTGPMFQSQTGDEELDRLVELEFTEYLRAIALAEKLTTARKAKATDGESLGLLITNPSLGTPVQLDWQLFETDQLTSPWSLTQQANDTDGIVFDRYGNPVNYYVLDQHPGDLSRWEWTSRLVPANQVTHWFRADRPGQVRGIPETTPALPLFAQLRRYTLATVGSAETAASFAGVMKTPLIPNTAAGIPAVPSMEFEHRMLVAMPDGYELQQLKPEQPITTYGDFVTQLVNEICQVFQMPLCIGLGNSSNYNFASGRLDMQVFLASIRTERSQCRRVVLDTLFDAWRREALVISGYLPLRARMIKRWPRQWFWPKPPIVDPKADAVADSMRLGNGTLTYGDYYAEQGADWREKFQQRAAELKLAKELGLPLPQSVDVSALGRAEVTDRPEVANAA